MATDVVQDAQQPADLIRSEHALDALGIQVSEGGFVQPCRVHETLVGQVVDDQVDQADEQLLAGSGWRVPEVFCEGHRTLIDDFVFVTRFGSPFDASTVTHRFQALLTRAGISHHRFHDLRHTAATLLAIQGVHPRAIQAALGWENLSMLNRYAHFVEEQRQAVANAMDSILEPVAVSVAVKQKTTAPH